MSAFNQQILIQLLGTPCHGYNIPNKNMKKEPSSLETTFEVDSVTDTSWDLSGAKFHSSSFKRSCQNVQRSSKYLKNHLLVWFVKFRSKTFTSELKMNYYNYVAQDFII